MGLLFFLCGSLVINLWNILSNNLNSNLAAFLSVTLRKNTRDSELSETFKSHQKIDFCCCSCPGIAMLTFALLMSARMGIFQEMLYKQYGKHSKEALFYNVSGVFFPVGSNIPEVSQPERKLNYWLRLVFNFLIPAQHCLPLPGFLLLSTDIYNHCVYFSQSSESLRSNLCRKRVAVEKSGVFLI